MILKQLGGNILSYSVLLFAVTGASRGYAFVEFETDRDMRRAYKVVCSLQ